MIFLDADCRIVKDFPDDITWPKGIVINYDTQRSMAENIRRFCSQDTDIYDKFLKKITLEIDLEKAHFPVPNVYVITKDDGKEKTFLEYWEKITHYTELHQCKNVYDAYPMGIALACVGWTPVVDPIINISIKHMGQYGKGKRQPLSFFIKQKKRILYYSRWIKIFLTTVFKDFKFYFG